MKYHSCWTVDKNKSQKVLEKGNICITVTTDNKCLNGKKSLQTLTRRA